MRPMPTLKAAILCAMVGDQDEALAWYTEKLGFEKRVDMNAGDWRWITVTAPGQPDDPHFIEFAAEAVCELTSGDTWRVINLKPGRYRD